MCSSDLNIVTGDSSVIAGGLSSLVSGRWSAIGGGRSNMVEADDSVIGGGDNNYVSGRKTVVPGGSYNTVKSSYSFAGGFNSYLDTPAQGTFVWGYDDVNPSGTFNTFRINTPYLFLIDPANIKNYKVGIGTATPHATLDVNGNAQFTSSVAVKGEGLGGMDDVLNVKNGALVVRNDGRVGVGTASPAVTLDVNGAAQFGAGVDKSTFTENGFWQPRAISTADLQAAAGQPTAVGQVVLNSTISDLCVSTGTAVGQWALVGSKGALGCF